MICEIFWEDKKKVAIVCVLGCKIDNKGEAKIRQADRRIWQCPVRVVRTLCRTVSKSGSQVRALLIYRTGCYC